MFTKALKQDITYWAPLTENEFGGKTFSRSVIKGRWEDTQELIRDKKGQEIVSKSRAFFAQDISINGYLFLGTSTEDNPRTVAGAFEVKQTKKTPDLRNVKQLRVAFL